MRILAIDTATEACSLALFDGDDLVAAHHRILGRGHAEQLVPAIAALPGKGRADAIRVSLGPGSFTGTRIGIAAARALGIAWQVPVLGFPTLALVSAGLRLHGDEQPATVAMTGGHGEIFVQRFDASGLPMGAAASLDPAAAAAATPDALVIGTMAQALVDARGWGEARTAHPDARALPFLPTGVLTDQLAPLYGRAPDARMPSA